MVFGFKPKGPNSGAPAHASRASRSIAGEVFDARTLRTGMMLRVAYDLAIGRAGQSDPINRHRWLSYALKSVALVQLRPDQEIRRGIEFPAFGLFGHYNKPVLFWRDGQVVIKYAGAEHLSDLNLIAEQLEADLVETDTGPEE